MQLMRSWVDSANSAVTDFPLNNLPYGVFDDGRGARCGVAIGDKLLDLGRLATRNMFPGTGFDTDTLNTFMAAGPALWARVRNTLTGLLAEGSKQQAQVTDFLIDQSDVTMRLPFAISEFTDFYAGRHHAQNVGTMFRGPENALPANWLSIPIGYNGRASSVVVSGTDVVRPTAS